ncbi:cytidylyltransferase domain-containing protein [Bacteroides hominis]|uniref:cytidylyltransferase domain-containing protein n=1 Tax=Bacteroides hominis TaxID=2763023 RepID=UPI003D6C86BD|nr:glycosyltransferase family protein [Bacteroides fragilis]MCS3205049.1 glycosyltransferase family protein [Bacteroides fragilis]
MKILAITQARYGSTRLPAKILKEVNGQTLLEIHLKRILRSKTVNKLKIATTDEEGSKYIVEVANKLGVEYFKGSVDDVLSRFYGTAESEKPDYVIRLTSDCPLIDPNVIDTVVTFALEHPEYDYVHTDAKSFPDGLDTEVMKFSAIEKAHKEADLKSEREHVTPYIWKNGTANGGEIFKTYNYPNPAGDFNADDYRITIDEPEDFEVIKTLIEHLGIDKDWKDYIDYLLEHKEVYAINSKFANNEGYAKSLANDSVINK